MNEYCCDKFYVLNGSDKNFGLNIRVVKIPDEVFKTMNMQFNKVVFITEGYVDNIDNCSKKVIIEFCPFCGSSLNYLKFDDSFVQENVNL